MSIEKRTGHHSDLAPSSKDWQPGSPGRDEDFTPEKDLWTKAHKGDLGKGRPGEDVHAGGTGPGGGTSGRSGDEVQPGTQKPGKSWTSEHNLPSDDECLDEALEDTFPASDPPAATDPATGWITGDAEEKAGGKRD